MERTSLEAKPTIVVSGKETMNTIDVRVGDKQGNNGDASARQDVLTSGCGSNRADLYVGSARVHDDNRDPEPLVAPASKPARKPRVYYVDWMRTIAIYLVVSVHVALSLQRVIVVDVQTDKKIQATFRSLLQSGMPLFFYFSGRAACMSNDKFLVFLWKKTLRLFIPVAVGELLVVIPTCFIGRKYRPCASPDVDNFFLYYVDFFQNQFICSKIEWLWFLPVLYGFSILNFPVFEWIKTRHAQRNVLGYSRADLIPLAKVAIPVITMPVLSNVLIGASMPWMIMSAAPQVLLVLVVPWLPALRGTNFFMLAYMTNAIPSLTMAYALTDYIEMNRIFAAITFYNLFYAEGFVDHMLAEDYAELQLSDKHLRLRPFGLFATVLLLAVCAPGTEDEVGYLFTYPIYNILILRVLYVIGTWITMMFYLRYAQAFYNEELQSALYKHGMQSTIVVYIVHWLFLEIIQVNIVMPLKMNFVAAYVLTWTMTILLCWTFYFLITYYIPFVGVLFGVASAPMPGRGKKKIPPVQTHVRVAAGH